MSNNESPFERRLFTTEERQAIQERLLEIARADSRIVAGALLGSLAQGASDRWSDLDLTFGLATGTGLEAVLTDWTAHMAREFGAVPLFDLPRLTSNYRVFLLANNLQVDLSFTPETDFAALGPKSRCCSARPLSEVHCRNRQPSTCLDWRPIMPCGASALSVNASGRPSIGSVTCVTPRSRWRACAMDWT
jgi:hypothetical protein